MATTRVFGNLEQKTHMPFYSGNELLFCYNTEPITKLIGNHSEWGEAGREVTYRPWRMAWADWTSKQITTIVTGMARDAILCNPTFFWKDQVLTLTFIAGIPHADGFDYRLYQMTGESWESLLPPRQIGPPGCRTGFMNSRFSCFGGSTLDLVDRDTRVRYRIRTSLLEIARAAYDPDDHERFLLTGRNRARVYTTLLFNVRTQELQEIVTPSNCYKACLVGARLVFSNRESDDIEDYQLHITSPEIGDSEETVFMTAE